MNRKRLAAILLALVLAVAAAFYATRSRPEHLVPYTTPPIHPQGDRVTLLVPQGWTTDELPATPLHSIELRPQNGEHASLSVTLDSSQGEITRVVIPEGKETITNPEWSPGKYAWTSSSSVQGSATGRWLVLQYMRTDKAAFDATHAAIFRSARIIPGHEN